MTLKKFIWMIPFLVLCSCASINTKQEKTNPEEDRQALEDALQEVPIEVLEYDGDLSPLTLVDEVEMESADSLIKFREGDADQCISVIDSSATEAIAPYTIVGEYNPTYSDVALVDENDNQVAIDMIKSANGQATYLIPVSDFEENHNYHLKLLNENQQLLKELRVDMLNMLEDSKRMRKKLKDITEYKEDEVYILYNVFDYDKRVKRATTETNVKAIYYLKDENDDFLSDEEYNNIILVS